MKVRWVVYLCLLSACAGSARAWPRPGFRGLGFASPTGAASHAYGISPDGAVVVGEADGAVAWTDAGGLETLAGSVAWDVSAGGRFVVGQSGSPSERATRWDLLTGIADLPAAGSAKGISADGSLVVGSEKGEGGATFAFRWTRQLGTERLAHRPYSGATGVSADGSVIVGFDGSVGSGEAFRWTRATGMTGLGFLPGRSSSSTEAVSADGSTVVGWSGTRPSCEAFIWTDQTQQMQGLGVLPGQTGSWALDVSADGSAVVGGGDGPSGAFIWDPISGMRSLRGLLVGQFGLDLTGWSLGEAHAVSDDGLTLAGTGRNPEGKAEAWVASLPFAPAAAGDTDLDGDIDHLDYLALKSNYGRSDASWAEADFDADRDVDAADYIAARDNAALLPPSGPPPPSAALPEPTTLCLLAAAGAAMVAQKRRRPR